MKVNSLKKAIIKAKKKINESAAAVEIARQFADNRFKSKTITIPSQGVNFDQLKLELATIDATAEASESGDNIVITYVNPDPVFQILSKMGLDVATTPKAEVVPE